MIKTFAVIFCLFGCASINAPVKTDVAGSFEPAEIIMTQKQATEIAEYAFSMPGWKDVFDQTEFGREIADSIDQTDGFYAQLFMDMLEGWDVIFVPSWQLVPLKDGRLVPADGMTFTENKLILITIHECYGDSAFIHELGHVIRFYFGMSEDLGHKDYSFWSAVDHLAEEMSEDLCPKDYVRKRL